MPGVQLPQRKGRAGWRAGRTGIPAAVLLVLSTPVATWWLIGDQSTVPAGAEPDYAIRPWEHRPGSGGNGRDHLAAARECDDRAARPGNRSPQTRPAVVGSPDPPAGGGHPGRSRVAG